MADKEGSIYYDSFTSAVATLKESGRGSLLAKLDLKDMYRHIPLRSTDWNLLGLHWIIQKHIPAKLRHYQTTFSLFSAFNISAIS